LTARLRSFEKAPESRKRLIQGADCETFYGLFRVILSESRGMNSECPFDGRMAEGMNGGKSALMLEQCLNTPRMWR